MPETTNVVIYHDQCFDGLAAAWVASNALVGPIAFYPCKHGDPVPTLQNPENCNVYILDFSFPREQMVELYKKVNFLLVLDHHKTAEEDCKGLSFCNFDMNRSGAGLAWDYFHTGVQRPKLISYIEDRDLWKLSLKYTKEIHAYIASFPKGISWYDKLYEELEDQYWDCVREGTAILRYQEQKIEEICNTSFFSWIGDYGDIPTVNCTYQFGSDAANRLLELHPDAKFAAYFFFTDEDTVKYGLRGRNSDDFDVSAIAKQYGGGGHKKAAGFTTGYVL